MFTPAKGDCLGLTCNDKHLKYQWVRDDCEVYFSVARLGNAASCHFSSDKPGLRNIKQAIDEFVGYVFSIFDWCTMVLANVKKPSVARIVEKCGFVKIAKHSDGIVYMRVPKWET